MQSGGQTVGRRPKGNTAHQCHSTSRAASAPAPAMVMSQGPSPSPLKNQPWSFTAALKMRESQVSDCKAHPQSASLIHRLRKTLLPR